MNNAVLTELANKWERDAEPPPPTDCCIENTEQAKIQAAITEGVARGHRECKRECADVLKMLVDSIG